MAHLVPGNRMQPGAPTANEGPREFDSVREIDRDWAAIPLLNTGR
jgi:hypothetical protein